MKVSLTRISFSFILCIILGFSLSAQRTINGKITDEQTGEPLIGANVLVTANGTGTVSDFDGNYAVDLPEGATEIIVSYTGYQDFTLDVSDNSTNTIDIKMTSGELLDEVVVIGYGTVKREDATGAITTVSAEEFNKGAIATPQELLVGKVPGVQITTGSAPGDGSVIRIRGGSSLSASNDPLIVIDGVPIDNGGVSGSRNALNILNPNDIETFTVLKDASATAIYGSRASNGVILITTKKGSLGNKIGVSYSGNISISSNINTLDVLNAGEYRSLIESEFPANHPSQALLGNSQTDWQDEIYQTSVGTDHSLTLSGGIANILPYRLSVGYNNRNGILKTDEFNRTTVGLNLSPGFMDNTLQINFNIKSQFTNNRFANRGAIGSAVNFDPTQSVLDGDSQYGGYFTWIDAPTGNPNGLAPPNPVALLELRDDRSEVSRYLTSFSVDYRFPFLEGLRANLNLGYDYAKGEGTTQIPTNASFAFNELTGGGTNNRYSQTKKNELLEFYLNYVKDIGSNRLDVMGGYSWQRNFFENYALNSDVAGTPTETQEFEDSGELFLLSVFGRANFTLLDKFIFTATLRGDASSRFSPETRWGVFPSAAFAWKAITNGSGPLNMLKVRLGYGVTGQQEIGSYYQYLPTYTVGLENAAAQFGNEFVTTLRPEEYDANIKWEETTTYNVGVDFGLYKDRIYGSLEVYLRKTKDLLNRIPVAAGTNLSNFIDTNVGDLENRGVELSVNFVPVKKKNLIWDVGFNITRNENEITKLTATDDPDYQGVFVGGIAGGIGNTVQIHSVGFPANTFFLYEQVYDEGGNPIEGLYVDRNQDGVISPLDLYRSENPVPEVFMGFNTAVSYGAFEFRLSGRANVGNYIYNNVQSDNAFLSKLYHPTNYLTNAHSDVADIQFQNPQYLSDHFLYDGSFLRLDFISLAYNLQDLFGKKNNVTLSATMQNPLLITNYSGVDPEIFNGIDSNIYPRSRTFVFGVSANF